MASSEETSQPSSPAPRVKFTISSDDGQPIGDLHLILFNETVPKTVKNFLALSSGQCGYGYEGSTFHRIIPGFMVQGGDFTNGDGTGGKSIYGEKFPDENFEKSHDKTGILSMANSGPDSNGSQFFITFKPTPHLDQKHVVFGQLEDQSMDVLKKIESFGSESGEPSAKLTIIKAEIITENDEHFDCL